MHRPSARNERDAWLAMSDAELLRLCRVDAYRAGGPGGQKRNKTSSAVRIVHEPTGLMAIAEESRSQHENKARALQRLRLRLALETREDHGIKKNAAVVATRVSPSGSIEISRRHPDYTLVVAAVLDALAICKGHIATTAADLGLRTSQLSRFLTAEGNLLAAANQIRAAHNLKPLRPTA